MLKYIYIRAVNRWKCRLCGKLVEEYGWSGHNKVHKPKVRPEYLVKVRPEYQAHLKAPPKSGENQEAKGGLIK